MTTRVYHSAYRIFTFYRHKASILVANVYVSNLEEWLYGEHYSRVTKSCEAAHFARDWRLSQLNLTFTK